MRRNPRQVPGCKERMERGTGLVLFLGGFAKLAVSHPAPGSTPRPTILGRESRDSRTLGPLGKSTVSSHGP